MREQDARLAAALDVLPADMRLVIVRRVFHQEPFETVARALDRSPGAGTPGAGLTDTLRSTAMIGIKHLVAGSVLGVIGFLTALLLPAVQSARESARPAQEKRVAEL